MYWTRSHCFAKKQRQFFFYFHFPSSTDVEEAEPLSWRFWRKRRYIVVLLAFLGFFNVYSLRVNLSVAIVAMTENRTVVDENGHETWHQDFPWDSKQKGLILSSFFYGYIMTQFVGGFIGAKIGGNIVSRTPRITNVSLLKHHFLSQFRYLELASAPRPFWLCLRRWRRSTAWKCCWQCASSKVFLR